MNHSKSGEHFIQFKERTNQRLNMVKSSLMESARNFRIGMLIADPWPFLLLWTLSGIFALILPRNQWKDGMDTYYTSYGYQIEYQNAQRAYEEAQRNQNDGNNNNYYNNYQSSSSSSGCRWFQYMCRKNQYEKMQYYNYYYGNQGNQNEDEISVPFWYRFIGGVTEQDQRNREEQRKEQGYSEESSQATTQLRWVYAWMIVMFVGILLHGMYVMVRKQSTIGLRFGLFLYGQFCVLSILLIGQGVIQSDQRELEDSIYGWYGQLGVLMVYTNYWLALFCLVFIVLLQIRAIILSRRERMQMNKANDVEPDQGNSTSNNTPYGYRIHNDIEEFLTPKPIQKGSMA